MLPPNRLLGDLGISCKRLALAAAALALSSLPAVAAYHIDAGDIIEISVTRIPELQRRVPVQLDGSISFPLIGSLAVAGLSPSELQSRIRAALSTRVFRQRLADGSEYPVEIRPEEVIATVVEYRPIYVDGDVAKPGEYPYRLPITVRQAIALSGGYDPLRSRSGRPGFERADWRSDYDTLSLEAVKEQVQLARISAELQGKDDFDHSIAADGSVPEATITEIVRLETERLKSRLADYQHDAAFLQRSIKQADAQIAVLTEQQQKEQQGVVEDQEELKRVNNLFGSGNLPSPRVTDARRAVLLSSTRSLQTQAELMQVRRQQDELARQLQKLDDQRRMALLQEMQDTNAKLGEVRAKLRSIVQKLQAAAQMPPVAGESAGKLELAVLRRGEKGWERLHVDENYELEPGDLVEVSSGGEAGAASVLSR